MLGIGIIGGGRVSRAHGNAAEALAHTRLVGIAEVDPERRATSTAQYGCRGYASAEEMLADDSVEAVVVALPHWLHADVAVAALRAGRHVLIEKPMAMNVEECDRILAAARESGRTLMIGHSQHFFPINREAVRRIAAGDIGEPVFATDTWYKPFWEGQRPPWFLDDTKGGGMWSMNGSHMLDRLQLFLQRSVVSVNAAVGNRIFGLSTDFGVAFVRFEGGLAATIQHVGYKDGVNRFEAEITGTQAQLRINGDRSGCNPLEISRNGSWEALPVAPLELELKSGASDPPGAFAAQMQDFALAVREGRPPSVTGDWGRSVVAVLEACVQSSCDGGEVRL